MTVFFTSDLHLGHENIIRMSERPFRSVEHMNERLIDNINAQVNADDILWILGDIAYKFGQRPTIDALKRVNCNDIRLVMGNHDKDWLADTGIFTEICDYKELKLDGRRICLMHYPIASWNGMHHGSVHLHGHSHNGPDYNLENVMNERLVWDVGVDANDYKPIS